jgi:FMN-dependent oxidoreductase (nitrilotriacetate monooxygenase family)
MSDVDRPFHLGYFTGFVPDEWNGPLASGGGDFWNGHFYVELAQALERAKFDFLMFEDAVAIPDTFGGSRDLYLRYNFVAPKGDPVPLAAIIGYLTRHLGVGVTMSTTFTLPYHVARLCSTMDSLLGGRFGWNLVTTAGAGIAENYGLDKLPDHDERYEIADETVSIAKALWNSWEEDAVVRDRENWVYADASKVHEINYRGTHFSSRGPLNTVRSPQGQPVLIQAGASPAGMDFAAKHAEVIVTAVRGTEAMKAYRDEIRGRMMTYGRDPDTCKVLFVVTPIVGRTDEEAQATYETLLSSERTALDVLARVSGWSGHDLSQYDLDEPLPEMHTEASRGILERLAQWGTGKTLRQCVREMGFSHDCIDLVGSPDTVADAMCAAIDEVGGDGYLIESPGFQPSRAFTASITDGLVPALQRRGRVRTEYRGTTFRDHLLEF